MKGISCLVWAFLCLLAGALIYVLYAPTAIFINITIASASLSSLRQKIHWLKYIFPDSSFTRYHLPDILWYQALLFIIYYIYHIKKVFHLGLIYYISLSLPFILEFLQLAHMIPGTFDWLDILCYFILLFLNYCFYIRKKMTYEKQDNSLSP